MVFHFSDIDRPPTNDASHLSQVPFFFFLFWDYSYKHKDPVIWIIEYWAKFFILCISYRFAAVFKRKTINFTTDDCGLDGW